METLQILSRNEMKMIKGGGICHFWCCSGGPGTCGSEIYHAQLLNAEPGEGSNEACQTAGLNGGLSCPDGTYLAALYM